MRTQSDAAESDQQNQRHRQEKCEDSQRPGFELGNDQNEKLPIKQSRANRVTACKTVTGPVHKRPFKKGALTMNVSPEKRRSWQRSVYAVRLTGRVGRAIGLMKATSY